MSPDLLTAKPFCLKTFTCTCTFFYYSINEYEIREGSLLISYTGWDTAILTGTTPIVGWQENEICMG